MVPGHQDHPNYQQEIQTELQVAENFSEVIFIKKKRENLHAELTRPENEMAKAQLS